MVLKVVTISFLAGTLLLSSRSIYRLLKAAYKSYYSPLKKIPGPVADSFVRGHFKQLVDPDLETVHEKWVEEYGDVLAFNVILNFRNLYIVDTRAVSHVLSHAPDYPKPVEFRNALMTMLGDGLVAVEGETHRRERRIMSPAFGLPQIRDLTTIFIDKSFQLRDIWADRVRSLDSSTEETGSCKGCLIDVCQDVNKMTLDVIGLAGFNYAFDALNSDGTPNELNRAFRDLMANPTPSLLGIIQTILPWTRYLKENARDRRVRVAREIMERVGRSLLSDMKVAVRATAEKGEVARKDFSRKDLLSLLVRANMANDVPESNRLTDEEMLAQIPTFLFAGHETTSAAISWILYALACDAAVQDTLRAELRACPEGERPDMDALGRLPYLDAVVREALRLYSPVHMTMRAVDKDDVIPTAGEWTDTDGVRRSGIPVKKGNSVIIPIMAMNRSKKIWGDDAYEFKPERWSTLPDAARAIPGIWGNSLTFFGGARACIGFRFAVMETKATIYTLVRRLRFELGVERSEIVARLGGMTRPHLRNELDKGPQLPLLVSLVETD